MKQFSIIPLLIVGGLVLGASIFGASITASSESIRNIFNPRPQVQVTSSQTIVQSMRPLGQLVSVSTQVAKVDLEINIRRGIANICNFTAKHAAMAEISAGVDLTQIRPEDIVFDEASDTYLITLPAPELTSCSLDPVQTQQYSTGGATPVCNIRWDDVRRLASYVALREFRDEAVEGGLLDRARQHSDIVLTNFVSALTGKNVSITYRESGTLTYPNSCSPRTPGRWRYDDTQQRWIEE